MPQAPLEQKNDGKMFHHQNVCLKQQVVATFFLPIKAI
jgi:hypothetical protein